MFTKEFRPVVFNLLVATHSLQYRPLDIDNGEMGLSFDLRLRVRLQVVYALGNARQGQKATLEALTSYWTFAGLSLHVEKLTLS